MSISMELLGNEIQPTLTLADASNVNADNIMTKMKNVCDQSGIPAKFRKDKVIEGRILNKRTYECVIVSHPNPPQDYASQIYVIAGDTIIFRFIGVSKAAREQNEYDAVRQGKGTTLQSMKYIFKQPNTMELEREKGWHSRVIDAFNSLIQ